MSIGRPLTEEQINYIRENFKDCTNQEIADALGISKSAVSRVQKRYGLYKSPAHNHRISVKAGKASAKARNYQTFGLTPEVISRRVESYKRTFREERARATFGLPQRTKIKVKVQPRKKCHQRAYLKHLGYILDEANNIAYYTESTTRATRMEARPREYYKFMPYEQQRKQDDIQVADRPNP